MSRTFQKLRVPDLALMKERCERIVMLTAYDATMARLLDRAGIDLLLVGDSLAQVMAEEALRNAARLFQEGGAAAVKVEGGRTVADVVRRLTAAGLPVMGHDLFNWTHSPSHPIRYLQ